MSKWFYFFTYPGTPEQRPVGPFSSQEDAEAGRASHAAARPGDSVSATATCHDDDYIQQWYAALNAPPLTEPPAE